jgi:alkaline phosphatase D
MGGSVDRRRFLQAGAVGAAGLVSAKVLAGCAPMPGATSIPFVDPVWDCGVASGLHSADAAVLWTRCAPAASAAVDLTWEVSTTPTFTSVVADGVVTADPDRDGCAKVLAGGLAPGATYWYRFRIGAESSPVGRTRTPAAAGTTPDSVRLAVASCQNYQSGFYSAWRDLAATDLDAVVFLGDYIYESGSSRTGVRPDPVGAATDLATYRAKYRLYRSDPQLRAAHAAHAFAVVWDDHEFVNNCSRVTILEDPARAEAAYRAWFEYQPVWPIDGTRTYRRARFGDLVDLSLLDTRQYRDAPPGEGTGVGGYIVPGGTGPEIYRSGRTILGDAQRGWLIDLDEPALRALQPDLPEHAGVYLNEDAWDGFQAERDTVLESARTNGVTNLGFLTGDIHSFWQAALRADFDDPRSPVVGQEFVCGSVSSSGPDLAGYELARALGDAAKQLKPGFRYVDLARRGVGVVTCTPERASVEFRVTSAAGPLSEVRRGSVFDWQADTANVALTPG